MLENDNNLLLKSENPRKNFFAFKKLRLSQNFWVNILILIIIICWVALAVSSTRKLSATNDETWHVISGLTFLKMGDLRANTDNPYPINSLSALPLYLNKSFRFLSWNDIRYRTAQPGLIGEKVAKINGGEINQGQYTLTTEQLFRPRVIMISFSALFLFTYALLLWKYFNWRTGLLALIFLGFSPTILAHGSLTTTDMAVSATIFLASFALWVAYHAKTNSRFATLLVVFSVLSLLALLSKYTALVVAPFWLILVGYAVSRKKYFGRLFYRILIGIAVSFGILAFLFVSLYSFYDFKIMTLQQTKFENKDSIREEKELLRNTAGPKFVELYERLPLPFPYYIRGVMFNMIFKDVLGHESYFLGKYENVGPWYYLIAFAVKETVPFVIISAFFVLWGFSKIKLVKKNKDWLFLLVPPIVIAFVFSFSNVKIGIRHVLPVYPFLALGTAIFADRVAKNRAGRALIIFGVLSIFFTAFNAFPNYLSYFNLFASGSSNGYKWLQDSNYDWGQNELQAKQLIKKFGNEISYNDPALPEPGKYYLLRMSEIYARPRNLDEREIALRQLLEQGKLKIIDRSIPTHWLVYYPIN